MLKEKQNSKIIHIYNTKNAKEYPYALWRFLFKTARRNETKEYFFRNNLPYENIKLTNKYRKVVEISHDDIENNKVRKRQRGF